MMRKYIFKELAQTFKQQFGIQEKYRKIHLKKRERNQYDHSLQNKILLAVQDLCKIYLFLNLIANRVKILIKIDAKIVQANVQSVWKEIEKQNKKNVNAILQELKIKYYNVNVKEVDIKKVIIHEKKSLISFTNTSKFYDIMIS